jgi:hypothetical protein
MSDDHKIDVVSGWNRYIDLITTFVLKFKQQYLVAWIRQGVDWKVPVLLLDTSIRTLNDNRYVITDKWSVDFGRWQSWVILTLEKFKIRFATQRFAYIALRGSAGEMVLLSSDSAPAVCISFSMWSSECIDLMWARLRPTCVWVHRRKSYNLPHSWMAYLQLIEVVPSQRHS